MDHRRILLIEDEPAAAKRLQQLIREVYPSGEVVDTLDRVDAAVSWLSQHQADLIFMDVQLADGLCFEIFDQVRVDVPVIFTTAYDAYALKAFRVQALDYLLKPIKQNELEEAIRRFTSRAIAPPPAAAVQSINLGTEYRQRFMVKLGTTMRVVDVSSIAYLYTESKTTFLMTTEGRRFPMDYSLEVLESQLDPALFFRANRQFILHIEAIRDMHVHSKSRVRVQTDPPAPQEIIVSTEKSSGFKRWLAGHEKGG